METAIIIASIIGILFVVSKYLRNVKKHTAAMNALVAKATLSTLPTQLQGTVIGNAVHVLIKGSHCSFERAAEWINEMDEKSKYGVYAISMMELGVEPISKKWKWQVVSNPFVALINAEREIKMAQLGLKSDGIEVSFGENQDEPQKDDYPVPEYSYIYCPNCGVNNRIKYPPQSKGNYKCGTCKSQLNV